MIYLNYKVMIDKKKIREEIEKLHGNPYYMMAVKDVLEILDMQDEPVSEDWKDAYRNWCLSHNDGETLYCINAWKAAMDWQENHLWKPADGDDLPEIDREVVVFCQDFKNDPTYLRVSIGHRPDPNGWDGKSLLTGKIEHYTAETYGKGGWNIPNVKFWLDCSLPNMEEN